MKDRVADIKASFSSNLTDLWTLVESMLEENQSLRRSLDELTAEKDVATSRLQDLVKERNASWWSGDPEKSHSFMGYDIPIELMLMTGGGPASFDDVSAFHISNLTKWIGLESDYSVVEIGCGIGRDAIPLTKILTKGNYTGVDIIGRSIDWCSTNITPANPKFKFYHFDVDDELHNPTGTTNAVDIRVPVEDGTVDRIFLFSVFTHLLRPEIEHYLREFRRMLKPDGLVYATTFIYDDPILKSARETALTPFDLRFEHEITPGCRINDPAHPLGAVAFTREIWDDMVAETGMEYAKPLLKGGWSGFYQNADDGQDAVILRKV